MLFKVVASFVTILVEKRDYTKEKCCCIDVLLFLLGRIDLDLAFSILVKVGVVL